MDVKPRYQRQEEEIPVKDLILNMQDWIQYLCTKWVIFLLAGFLGGLAGLLYAFLQSPKYTATTTFVLDGNDGKAGLSQYAGMAAMVGIDVGGHAGGLFQGENILELYKSRSMLAQALMSKTHIDSSELLIERYISFNGFREAWKENPNLSTLDFRQNLEQLSSQQLRIRDSVITSITNTINREVLKVDKPDKKLSILKVEVISSDEVFSKAFNENLVRRVNDFYIQTKIKRSKNNVAILQSKVDSVRNVMTGAIYSAVRVSDATPNLNPTRQVIRMAPAQEAQFSAEANKAMLTQLLQNLEMARMSMLQEQPLIQLVDQPVYPLKIERLGKVKGVFTGGFLVGFMLLIFLVVQKWYRDLMSKS